MSRSFDQVPEPVVGVVVGQRAAVRPAGEQQAADAGEAAGALGLGHGVLDARHRQRGEPEEASRVHRAELAHPIVVGPDAGELQLAVLRRVFLRARHDVGWIEDVGRGHVDVHVLQARLGLEGALGQVGIRLAEEPPLHRRHADHVAQQRHRAHALAALVEPHLAAVSPLNSGDAVMEVGRRPRQPHVVRLVHVRVAVDCKVAHGTLLRRGVRPLPSLAAIIVPRPSRKREAALRPRCGPPTGGHMLEFPHSRLSSLHPDAPSGDPR